MNFQPPAWALRSNIYEVNLRQYSVYGNFGGFRTALPRLRDMGIDIIWFMPIHPIGKLNRKGELGSYYSISDYMQVNPEFGTLDEFSELTREIHSLGMKIMLDWVANHTAWDHVWTQTDPDFYTKSSEGGFMPPYPEWSDVIDLDFNNSRLRKRMIEAMQFWVNEFDIDGYRCDMAHLVPLDFWNEARKSIDSLKPLFWLAETEDPNYHQVFDASYTWEFLHKMEAYAKGHTNIEGLDSVLSKYTAVFPNRAMRVFFTTNHDENSHSGSEYERMGASALAFAVLCATWGGLPMIYSGQELPNHKRLKFFEHDPIAWDGQFRLHEFYRNLLMLRKVNPALSAIDTEVFRLNTNANQNVFSYLRKKGENEVLVALNLSGDDVQFSFTDSRLGGRFQSLFDKEIYEPGQLSLKPWDFLVLYK